MKVICIDNKPDCPELVEGEVYTARQSDAFADSYKLRECPYDPIDGVITSYRKERFIPLSQIDEMELLEQRQTELV